MGSPGLLKEGTLLREHVDGYDLLRTVESAFVSQSIETNVPP
jgi:hypothetical protein